MRADRGTRSSRAMSTSRWLTLKSEFLSFFPRQESYPISTFLSRQNRSRRIAAVLTGEKQSN